MTEQISMIKLVLESAYQTVSNNIHHIAISIYRDTSILI